MTLNAGLRGESHVARAVGALFSVTTLALVTGCDAGSQHVRIENYCDVAVQASYSTFVFQDPPDATNPSGYAIEVVEGAAIDVAAGASSALKIDINGAGYLVLRGSAGEWLTVSPLDTEAPPGSDGRFIKDGVFVVDGPVCAQVDG